MSFVRIYLLIFIISSFFRRTDAVPAVNFQSDGLPSVDSFVRYNKPIPDITAFTLCTHIQIWHTRGDDIPLISYAVEGFPDELLIMYDFLDKSVRFFCCGGAGQFTANSLMTEEPMLVWYHICISVDLVRGKYMVVLNDQGDEGNIQSLVAGQTLVIRGGGSLILGQEQDVLNGGFSIIQSLDGLLGGYVLVQQILPVTRMYEYARCRDTLEEISLVSFKDLQGDWTIEGKTNETDVPISAICTENIGFYTIFPDPYTLPEARDICNKVKGTIIVPETKEENDRLSDNIIHLVDQCSFSKAYFMWVGIQAKKMRNSTEFVDLETQKVIRYSDFRDGFGIPYGIQQCVFLDSYIPGKWIVGPCYTKSCVTCQLKRPTTFRMRGLCDATLLDTKYILFGYSHGKIKLEGIMHSKVYFDGSNWILRDTIFPNVHGKMIRKTRFDYPLGLNEWEIEGDNCPNSTSLLLMTSCNELQFTCSDGTCIDKMQRCDLSVDCPDQSDERRCTTVAVPPDYLKQVPPPKFGTKAATVNLHTQILSMQPIDNIALKVHITIVIIMRWRDPRINMESLNYEDTMNVIHNGDEIWQPELIFEDIYGSEADSTVLWQTFTAVMQSGPLDDDIFNVKEDEIYPGTSNSLKLTKSFDLRFSCPMTLQAYPFDSQACQFIIKLQQITQDFVRLNVTDPGVEYLGAYRLKEYSIERVIINESLSTNFSAQIVTIELENLYGFYVSTAYVPTFLMVVICYTTFYYDIDDFQNRIMVSLTALLVLATLFAQINQTTPKSAFLKLLDIWFVSCIMMNFCTVVFQAIINYIRLNEFEGDNGIAPNPFLSQKKTIFLKEKKDKAIKVNLFARTLVPVVITVFIIAYVIIAATYMQ